MIGGACAIAHDIPHYAIVVANPSEIRGANIIGLKRAGFDIRDIKLISDFYNDYIKQDNTKADVLLKYQNKSAKVDEIIAFIQQGNKRSI